MKEYNSWSMEMDYIWTELVEANEKGKRGKRKKLKVNSKLILKKCFRVKAKKRQIVIVMKYEYSAACVQNFIVINEQTLCV